MNFSELVARNENMSFKDVLPVLLPIYMNAHNWNIEDAVNTVYERKKKYILNNVLIVGIRNKAIDGETVYDFEYDEDGIPMINSYEGPSKVLIDSKSYVNIKSLIKYVASDIKDYSFIPDDLLLMAGIETTSNKYIHGQVKADPAIATELGTLRNEKLKWDASIRAATEIGLLFFEGELPKPTTKDAFVKEFNSKVGGLPDTTVEMIYKALPSKYRHKGGKPKIAKTETAAITGIGDLHIAIKAAVFAGSVHEEREAKDVDRLAKMLKENKYELPPTTVLEKIVEYVKDV